MIRVCGNEDEDDAHVKQEMDELRDLEVPEGTASTRTDPEEAETTDEEEDSLPVPEPRRASTSDTARLTSSRDTNDLSRPPEKPSQADVERRESVDISSKPSSSSDVKEVTCPICSMGNSPGSLLCLACSHVLDPSKVVGSWQCTRGTCTGSAYLNAGDCGICGVCGERKAKDSNG